MKNDSYLLHLKCNCHIIYRITKKYRIILTCPYDSTSRGLKIRFTNVTNNYYLYCTTLEMKLTFNKLKIMAMIGFGILIIVILTIIIIFK